MLELWVKTGGKNRLIPNDDGEFFLSRNEIKREKVSLRKHGLKAALFWNMFTFGNCCTYRIYDPYDSNRIIHESYVIHRCYKFPFLKNSDIEIGPCYTHKNWRGQGIYPSVLRAIIQKELTEHSRSYMIIDSSNTSSIRGVKKVGYTRVSYVTKSKFFKVYKPSKSIEV